ncbi:hypothetical protein CPB85DRAFT_1271834 [Mucidula mucida]|nr:hypothetical protein CPB85DRAFT_1271834 [Mucidula mucida]
MFPTLARLSKASRRPLTSKKANKDFYKGTRQGALPGGPFTGAPGKHVVRGKAKYRLVDEQVRVFVAPPIDVIRNSPLKPYVARTVFLSDQELLKETRRMTDRPQYWAAGMGPGGLSPERYLDVLTQNQGMVRPPELQTLEMRREKRRRQVAKRAALREDKTVAAISEKMSTVTV